MTHQPIKKPWESQQSSTKAWGWRWHLALWCSSIYGWGGCGRRRQSNVPKAAVAAMEWRKCYLDLVLIPLSLSFSLGYHSWLWHRVRTHPNRTFVGINSAARRRWVHAMMKDNEKKNILAVQSIRNSIMGVTLMATTSILLCCGLAAVLSSTYSVKKPINDSVYGAHGEVVMSLKYVVILLLFVFSFFSYSLSVRFLNETNFLINVPPDNAISADYVCELLERGFNLNMVGNRIFYTALPLLMWIFGPLPVLACSATMVPLLYNLDVLPGGGGGGGGGGKGEGVVGDVDLGRV